MPEHMVERRRETIAHVSRRNGAWLVQVTGPSWDERTEDQNHDAASSLVVAKRLARQFHADDEAVAGPYRWIDERGDGGYWTLEATVISEWDRYADDEY